MFESLNIPHDVSKAEFKAEEPGLRERLIDAQFELLNTGNSSVIVLMSGMDVLGRSACAKRLLGWLDSRYVRPYALITPTQEELERPRMWRFWQALPKKGRIGLFLNSWYEEPARNYVLGRITHDRYRQHLDEIMRFERLLAEEGTTILKFLLFLPHEQTIETLRKLHQRQLGAWKTSKTEREMAKEFANRWDQAMAILEDLISTTSVGHAPWTPVASADAQYRDLFVGRQLADTLENCTNATHDTGTRAVTLPKKITSNILQTLDLSQSLKEEKYKRSLEAQQRRLTKLTLSKKFEKRALVAVFEGNDAAGKGGSIRRVVQALDPRMLRVMPIAAPTDEERAQPYLWRFWRHIPRLGHITIFDRSWYGRVLVERVEGFCTTNDWMRAYKEIRAFESELADYGIIVVKFWLAIDEDEQLSRFKEREQIGHKRHKITDEDWRNREKLSDYSRAVHDMVDQTSTSTAPWTLVPANDKYFARVTVLNTLNERLKAELK